MARILTIKYHSGVAIGSSIGHAIGGLFSGGSSAPAEPVQAAAAPTQQNSSWGNNCAGATQQFTKCMDENGGNMSICGWYLDQLVSDPRTFTSFRRGTLRDGSDC